jgi:hypothetical protein
MNREKMKKWLQLKWDQEKFMQDTINMDHPTPDREAFAHHEKEMLMIEAIIAAIEADALKVDNLQSQIDRLNIRTKRQIMFGGPKNKFRGL